MRPNELSITESSAFGVPVFSAIIVHVIVGFLLFSSWNYSLKEPDSFELPKNIKAEFVQLEPAPPKPKVVQKAPKPTPKPQPKVAPKPKEEPKPKEAPKPAPPKPEAVVETPKPEPIVQKPQPVVAPPSTDSIDVSNEQVEPKPEPEVTPEPEQVVEEVTEEDLIGDLLAGLAEEEQAISTKIEQITQSQERAAQMQSEISNYANTIRGQIQEKWSRPVELRLMDLSNIEAVVSVQVLPTGELQKASIVRSSGNSNYDQSVIRAIERVRRFAVPDDPEVFEAGGFRNLNITFRPEDLMKS